MENLEEVLAAERAKDGAALRVAVAKIDVPAAVLNRLLLADWHDLHEDFVFDLGLLGDASSVGPISEAVRVPFAHLIEWGNLSEFQRKCAYALARIGTNASKSALEELTRSADLNLRAYGEEGLSHWARSVRS